MCSYTYTSTVATSEGDFYNGIVDDNGRDTFKKTVGKDPAVKKSGFKG